MTIFPARFAYRGFLRVGEVAGLLDSRVALNLPRHHFERKRNISTLWEDLEKKYHMTQYQHLIKVKYTVYMYMVLTAWYIKWNANCILSSFSKKDLDWSLDVYCYHWWTFTHGSWYKSFTCWFVLQQYGILTPPPNVSVHPYASFRRNAFWMASTLYPSRIYVKIKQNNWIHIKNDTLPNFDEKI